MPRPTTDAGLTPREVAVLFLVEGGCDKEIAATPFFTRRPTSKSISAVLAMFDASSHPASPEVFFVHSCLQKGE